MGDLQSMGSDGVVELKGGVVAGSGGSQAQDNACLCWERTRALWAVKPGGLPSLFSAGRVSGLSVLELTLCLSHTVPPSLLTSPQTACNGWVLWVTTPLSVDWVEMNGMSQLSLTPAFCVSRFGGCSGSWG